MVATKLATSDAKSPEAARIRKLLSAEIEFIGNAAFRITDGTTTLLTDFPYRSGASGYMSYEAADIGSIVDGVSRVSRARRKDRRG